jgi:hypothetical protein
MPETIEAEQEEARAEAERQQREHLRKAKDLEAKFFIDPDSEYDRKVFVKKAGKLFDLEGYSQRLSERTGDFDALKDLTSLLGEFIYGYDQIADRFNDPHFALSVADNFLSRGYLSMARFVENNRDEFLDKLSADQLLSIFTNLPLYKSGDPSHDRAIDLRAKVTTIGKVKDGEVDLDKLLEKELKRVVEDTDPRYKSVIRRHYAHFLPLIRHIAIKQLKKEFEGLFAGAKGKPDAGKLRAYLLDNYQVVEDFIEDNWDDMSEKERFDYWDKNLKAHYIALAKEAYNSEKKAQKREDDLDKEDRKAAAKKLGIAT